MGRNLASVTESLGELRGEADGRPVVSYPRTASLGAGLHRPDLQVSSLLLSVIELRRGNTHFGFVCAACPNPRRICQ